MQGADSIIQNAFGDIVLNHWYMFIGRGVVDGLHLPCTHDVKQLGLIAHRPQHGNQLYTQALTVDSLFKLTSNGIKVELTVVE
ncbi:hypothetical protein D3C81_1186870 [compost metagenome]